jgi:uncharacterized protein (DUF169 family)
MSTRLEELLDLSLPPVAIAFLPEAPAGLARVATGAPASCSYWRRAAHGESFYTEAADHLGCAVGAHTHGVPTNEEQKGQLMGLVQTMVGLEYLAMEEVPQIPHRTPPGDPAGFGVVAYAPLAAATFTPDVVLVRGDVRQLMLIAEAAQAAGVGSGAPTLGRPTCAVLPQALQSARASASFGCVGNRVYTGAGEGEGYFAIPGTALGAIEEKLAIVVRANGELKKFHEARNQPA